MRDHEKSNAYIKQKFKGKIVDIAIFLDGKKTRKLLVLEFPTKLKSLHMLSISQLCGCQKEEIHTGTAHGAAVWRPVVKRGAHRGTA